jgi:hypothetical protein
MSATLHSPSKATANHHGETTWLDIEADDGSYISIFMPYDKAKAMADAFNAQPPAPASFATSA